MAFWDRELSIFGGQPIEGFLFQYATGGEEVTRRYCSAGRDFVGANTWTAESIKREKYLLTSDTLKNDMTIVVPRTNEVALLFVGMPPEQVINVTIYRLHKSDSEAVVVWTGRVTSCQFQDDIATFICESVLTALKRQGLRAAYQLTCRHALFSQHCGLDENDWKSSIFCASDGYRGLEAEAFADQEDGWWFGGFVVRANGDTRSIISHSGNKIWINYRFTNFSGAGELLTVYPGCDLTVNTCQDKFDNVLNFGGFPFIPNKNPFSGDRAI